MHNNRRRHRPVIGHGGVQKKYAWRSWASLCTSHSLTIGYVSHRLRPQQNERHVQIQSFPILAIALST